MIASMPLSMPRRRFLIEAGLVNLAALSWPAVARGSLDQPAYDGSLMFTAYRNGSRLGFHRIDFSKSDKRLTVDIEIAFDVKLAFIPLYRYRHQNREVWEEGQLVSLDTETDDNGETFQVRGSRDGDQLIVEGADGRLQLPADTLTTSYWYEGGITRGEWIDTQSGRLARSEVTAKPAEPVLVAGETVEASRYDLAGDITCSLWYASGRWVKLRFDGEDGSEIEYTIEAPQQNG